MTIPGPRRLPSTRSAAVAVAVAVALGAVACSGGDGAGAPASTTGSAPAGSVAGTAPATSMTANPSSVPALARAAVEADGVTVHRVVAGDDVAVVHGQSPASSAAPTGLARVDVVRIGPDGSVVERATVRQPVAGPNPSGHTMFDGGGDPAAPVGEAERRANEAVVRRLYDEVFNGPNPGLVDELVAADYVQHSPAIGDGRDGLKALTANGLPVTVQRLVSQGDLVAAQVVYPGGVAAVDIFRVADGRIVEHWDVLDLSR